jgi:hypothetical protein
MTGTNCDLFTHNQCRSYLNHLVFCVFLGNYAVFKLCFVACETTDDGNAKCMNVFRIDSVKQ